MGEERRALVFEVGPFDRPAQGGWGWVALVASGSGLRMLNLPAPTREMALRRAHAHYPEAPLAPEDAFLNEVAAQVCNYLAGTQRKFNVELDLRGYTAFELSVWAAIARIPYGETRTYAWIAAQTGGPGAAQAVGAATGSNPIPLIIPCHRVIGSDGSLHGFAGGLDMKKRLLALESRQMTLALD